jgi:hypothetical protein
VSYSSTYCIKRDDGRYWDDVASNWVSKRTSNCLFGTAAAVAEVWVDVLDLEEGDCRIVRLKRRS